MQEQKKIIHQKRVFVFIQTSLDDFEEICGEDNSDA